MSKLGTLEELPAEYRDQLSAHNLVPLWPSMRSLLPYGVPSRRTQALAWPYRSIRPLLLRAGELTPMEKAERRVLVLANPGHGLDRLRATPSIYLGMQLVLPGEAAPNHRHTPSAVRIVVEGEGAHTTVDGEKCEMRRGDLILTPAGLWHEHHQPGADPIVWLDVLDLPLIYRLEASWAIEGEPQPEPRARDKSFAEYSAAGIVPETDFRRAPARTPMLRYPWRETRACLLEMAGEFDEGLLRIAYVNPETGGPIFPAIGFGAIMLRPGEAAMLPKRTTPCVFHAVEGQGALIVDGAAPLPWEARDSLVAPGYSDIELRNLDADRAAFLITADEAPLHACLGIY